MKDLVTVRENQIDRGIFMRYDRHNLVDLIRIDLHNYPCPQCTTGSFRFKTLGYSPGGPVTVEVCCPVCQKEQKINYHLHVEWTWSKKVRPGFFERGSVPVTSRCFPIEDSYFQGCEGRRLTLFFGDKSIMIEWKRTLLIVGLVNIAYRFRL